MDTSKEKAIEALIAYRGIVTTACESIGLARSTFYNWCKEDPEFKAAVDDVNDVSIDFVEGKLFELIEGVFVEKGVEMDKDGDFVSSVYKQKPDTTAIIFYLKTKAKKRGYIEKTEIEHSGGIKTTKDLSDDELAAIASNQ